MEVRPKMSWKTGASRLCPKPLVIVEVVVAAVAEPAPHLPVAGVPQLPAVDNATLSILRLRVRAIRFVLVVVEIGAVILLGCQFCSFGRGGGCLPLLVLPLVV